LLTFVIIGAGPTGVELAGHHCRTGAGHAAADFRNIDTPKARVVLIEAGPRVLAGFADDLSAYAQRSLESIGVDVKLGQAVTECTADSVVYGGNRLDTKTIIWAAGVRASPAAEWLGAPADRAGRLQGPARPHGAQPSRHLRHRRYRCYQWPRWQAGPRHCAGSQTTGTLCRGFHQGAPARRHARSCSDTSMPAAWRRSASARR